MSFFDLVKLSFTNLYQRKTRTILTILGVIIGTMSIVLMIALGEGSNQVFMEQVSQSSDLTQIMVYPQYSSNPREGSNFDDKVVKSFEDIPNVRNVLPLSNISIYLKNSRYVSDLYIFAAPLEKLDFVREKLEWGDISKSKDVQLIVGNYTSMDSFRIKRGNKPAWELQPATDISFETEKFELFFGGSYFYSEGIVLPDGVVPPTSKTAKVTGVLRQTGSEFDYSGFIDINFVRELKKNNKKFAEYLGIQDNYQQIYVYADVMDNVEGVVTAIKDLGYQCYSPMESIKMMQEEASRQQSQWGMIGAIALLVSAIGIVNTMLTSIIERKREIGVLKVLGCSMLSINIMFLIEAAVIGLLGGLIAIGLSYGISYIVTIVPIEGNFLGSFFGGNVRFVITPTLSLLAISGAAAIGMVAGVYPAMRAMRMSPLSALRDE